MKYTSPRYPHCITVPIPLLHCRHLSYRDAVIASVYLSFHLRGEVCRITVNEFCHMLGCRTPVAKKSIKNLLARGLLIPAVDNHGFAVHAINMPAVEENIRGVR